MRRAAAPPTLAAMTRPRQIVAFGGGGFSMEAGNPLLDDYVLGLAAAAGRDRPKVCFLPTASGDATVLIGFQPDKADSAGLQGGDLGL